MTYGLEHLCIHLFALKISSSMRCLLGDQGICPFLNWVVCVLIEFYMFFVYFGVNESFVRCLLKIFFPCLAFDFA